METKVLKTRSAFRRSLMAFVIAATPVVAVAGISSGASAATFAIDFECTSLTAGGITVDITPGIDESGDKYSIHIKPASATWPTGSGNALRVNEVVRDKTAAEINALPLITSYGGAGSNPIVPLSLGVAYDLKIVAGNGGGDQTAVSGGSDQLTIQCAAIDFDGVVDEFVSIDCDSEPASILVTLPQRDPPSAKGPKYRVYVYEDEAKGFDEESDPLDQGGSDTFDTGEGTFIIEIYLPNEDVPVYENEITVDCTIPRNPGGGYNFNFKLPKATTAPVLPNTGSESNSLLAVAPLMVLLGGALIVARRRLANA